MATTNVDDSFTAALASTDDPTMQIDNATMIRRFFTRILGIKNLDDNPLYLALDHTAIYSMVDWMSMPDEALMTMQYKFVDTSGKKERLTTQALPGGFANLAVLVKHFGLQKCRELGYPVSNNGWENITREDFTVFRCLGMENLKPASTNAPMTPKSTTSFSPSGFASSPPAARSVNHVDTFKKSIKRDKNNYPVLKSEANWDKWKKGFIIQARADDVADILDPTYTPKLTRKDAFLT